jgi:DNA-binding MarR family transcriptional regulator
MTQSEIERAVGYLVKRVQQALRRTCDVALKPTGLSMAQYAVLRALADHPDVSAAQLARLCFVTRQSLQDVLAGLRSAGLIETADGPARGRARPLQLSPRGVERLTSGHNAMVSVESAMVNGLSPTAREELAEMLTRCAENLEKRD